MTERKVSEAELKLWQKVRNLPFRINLSFVKEFKQEVARVEFNTTLDLHGYTIQDAYQKTKAYLEKAKSLQIKEVVIITGKSGSIREEFPRWMEQQNYLATSINTGSFKVISK